MSFIRGFVASLALVLLTALTVDACSKSEPVAPVVAPVVVVAPNVVAPSSVSTPASMAPTPTASIATKVVAVKHRKSHASSSDTAAYAKAHANAARAACLRKYVDMKLDGDVKLGRVRDFDSVLTSDICAGVVKDVPKVTPVGAKAHGAKKHSTTGHKTPAASKKPAV
jgi:hypothetical protein